MRQLTAGVKKEWLELSRTHRLIALLLTFVGFGVLDPLVIRGVGFLLKIMNSVPELSELEGMPGMSLSLVMNQSMGLSAFVGDCVNTCLLVAFLLLMRAAGGEQKKRNCIIPITLGFDRECYIYAKFLVYPPLAMLLTFAGFFTAYGASALLFSRETIPLSKVLLPALALALFIAFQVSLLLGLGCATGKAGIWVAVLYGSTTLLNMALSMLGKNQYNPYALIAHASNFESIEAADYAVSAGIAVAVCFLAAVGSAIRFKRKKLV